MASFTHLLSGRIPRAECSCPSTRSCVFSHTPTLLLVFASTPALTSDPLTPQRLNAQHSFNPAPVSIERWSTANRQLTPQHFHRYPLLSARRHDPLLRLCNVWPRPREQGQRRPGLYPIHFLRCRYPRYHWAILRFHDACQYGESEAGCH